ncbi:DNA-formamidopyrimidine glycosylase, partial [Serratia ureilytica]|uniref:zinc finger domain-containing protein n=1 Tax=Serratia ureilytica TaxID=300181 RepID=UPI001A2EFA85|nr:DNA-formamidopyrimidine glycosylase [Serratia ureilytica]
PAAPTWPDFCPAPGTPGHSAPSRQVHARGADPGRTCGTPIESAKHGQRSTFFCRRCQR